jgi:hypothetical protein
VRRMAALPRTSQSEVADLLLVLVRAITPFTPHPCATMFHQDPTSSTSPARSRVLAAVRRSELRNPAQRATQDGGVSRDQHLARDLPYRDQDPGSSSTRGYGRSASHKARPVTFIGLAFQVLAGFFMISWRGRGWMSKNGLSPGKRLAEGQKCGLKGVHARPVQGRNAAGKARLT